MEEITIEFTVELAGIPVGIVCRHVQTYGFLEQYLTEKEPELTICPTDADLAKAEKLLHAEFGPETYYTASFLENNAVHLLLAEALVSKGVLLMHGSAIEKDGQAYIFTARSGVGKSTHAAHWKEVFDDVDYINDDKPLLAVSEKGITVYGTPWDGKHRRSRNISVPLRAIVSLKRGLTDEIKPMKAADAFAILYSQTYSSTEIATQLQILAMQKRISETVPFFALSCTDSAESAKISYNGIESYLNGDK